MKDSLFVSLSSPESGEEEDEQPGVKEGTEGADAEKKSEGESRLKTKELYETETENETYTILFFFFLPPFPGSRSSQTCITKLCAYTFSPVLSSKRRSVLALI